MNKKELEKYREILLEMKEKIVGNLNHLEGDNLNQSQKDSSGDLSGYSTHLADAASDAYDREFALNLASKEGSVLYDIDYALKRIDDGSYGDCELCEKPVPPRRLQAVPYTKLCIKCQELEEMKSTGRKRAEAAEEAPGRWEDVSGGE